MAKQEKRRMVTHKMVEEVKQKKAKPEKKVGRPKNLTRKPGRPPKNAEAPPKEQRSMNVVKNIEVPILRKSPGRPRSTPLTEVRVKIDPEIHGKYLQEIYYREGATPTAYIVRLIDADMARCQNLGGKDSLEQFGAMLRHNFKGQYNSAEVQENKALVDSILYLVGATIKRFQEAIEKPAS